MGSRLSLKELRGMLIYCWFLGVPHGLIVSKETLYLMELFSDKGGSLGLEHRAKSAILIRNYILSKLLFRFASSQESDHKVSATCYIHSPIKRIKM